MKGMSATQTGHVISSSLWDMSVSSPNNEEDGEWDEKAAWKDR